MATEGRVPDTAKPLSKASRVVCESLSHPDSQHRPPDARVKGKKAQQRPGNEMFVCFSPLPRPLLSPGREIVRETGRRKAHSGPVFSASPLSKGGKKQDYEDKDPTSPKVTCIGQVRANKNSAQTNDGIRDEHRRQKLHQSKLGWASPGRFFASPSKPTMWTSLFGSRKESNPPPCTSHGSDVSCFRLPCNSPAMMSSNRQGKRCGTFLAKFLILLQESEQRGRSKREELYARDTYSQGSEKRAVERNDDPTSGGQYVVDPAVEASDPPANALLLTRRKFGSIGSFLKRSSSTSSQDRIKKREKEDDLQADALPVSGKRETENNFQSNSETLGGKPPKGLQQSFETNSVLNMEHHRCVERLQASGRPEVCLLQEKSKVDAIPAATGEQIAVHHEVRQKPTDGILRGKEVFNEETRKFEPAPPPSSPSAVRLRRCDWETLKISLDVVPETWLWKNCGVVPLDNDEKPRRSSCIEGVREETKERETGYGIYNAVDNEKDEVTTASCTGEYFFRTEPGEHQISTGSPQVKVSIEADKKSFYICASQSESRDASHSESGCRHLNADQALGLDLATNSGECTKDTQCFNSEKQYFVSGVNKRFQKHDADMPEHISKGKPFPDEMECVEVEKQRYLVAFSGLDGDCLQGDARSNKNNSECPDPEKKSCRLAFSDLAGDSQNARNSQQTPKAIKHESGVCKEKKGEVPCPQSPNTVIFLGYKFETLSFSFNERQCDGERSQMLPGSLEVGRLSFKGNRTFSQWSKGGTEILHYCSPNHSTVIRLQRCNSEPWRPAS